MDSTGSFIMPPASSTIAPEVDTVFYFILGISIFFFVLVIGAATVFTVKYRRRGAVGLNVQSASNPTLEIVWTVIPLILVFIIFAMGFRVYLKEYVAPKDALEIKVTARRWAWSFTYPNGVVSNDLVVPAGKAVKLLMSSVDVIHGFFIPDFRIKQDVLPNRYTTTWFEAPDPGEHVLTCTQYCGVGHSQMLGKVRVLTQVDYDNWLASNVSGPAAGQSPVVYGQSLYKSKGCFSCHTTDGTPSVGPTLKGIYGTTVQLEGGKSAIVDENYIRESILEPQAKIVKSFQPVMPSFQGHLNDKDIDALIAFIKSLSSVTSPTPPSGGTAQPPPVSPNGQALYTSKSCVSCHTVDGSKSVGPTFKGLYGTKVTLTNGQTMTADSAYMSTCILEPDKTRVKGFQPVMPSFKGSLSDQEIAAIIGYIKSLSSSISGDSGQGGNK